MSKNFDRRTFMRGAALLPFAAQLRAASWLPSGVPRTLIVLELEGGNDGLNTVIPLEDANYVRLRPRLSAVKQTAVPIGNGMGLHMSLGKLAQRVQAGSCAIVSNVGYPKPDRSHFKCRDIWHSADPQCKQVRAVTTGWLGRTADLLAATSGGMKAVEIGGTEIPLLLRARNSVGLSLRRVEDFVLWAGDSAAHAKRRAALQELLAPRTAQGLLGYVAEVANEALVQSSQLSAALKNYQQKATYPDTQLARSLQLIARMVIAGFGTRLFHLGYGGFDTHARQLPTQQSLLRELDEALAAFAQDLDAHGYFSQTAVLVHSEFGRRVMENESLGTDHGAAAPLFVLSGGVRGGLHGVAPDLADLDDGDLKFKTDFRSVYQDLLVWLGCDATAVLGGEFAPVGLFQS
jgi:uncharacterized protein (DUF1501 family)